jgi:hypothetical protein
MVQTLDLRGIVFYEVSAARRESDNPIQAPGDDAPIDATWGLRVRHDGNEFGTRIRAEIETELGEVVVDVAAEYVASESFELPPRDLTYEFVNGVALMQLFPYIRESVMSLTGKVFGNALLMPVFQRGEIAFTSGEEAEQEI